MPTFSKNKMTKKLTDSGVSASSTKKKKKINTVGDTFKKKSMEPSKLILPNRYWSLKNRIYNESIQRELFHLFVFEELAFSTHFFQQSEENEIWS